MYTCVDKLLLLMFVASAPGLAFAQADTGTINGIVVDSTGAAIVGAAVVATNTGTRSSRSVATAANGTYLLASLPPGAYTVTINSKGFGTFQTQVQVTIGGRTPVEAKLAIGSSLSSVEVVAASGGSQVDTAWSDISEIITPQQVKQLPSLTRNIYDFVALSGNVSNGDATQGHPQNAMTNGVGFSINGQRSSGTEVLLDGVENMDLFNDTVGIRVPVDSVGEYRVVTNNFEPQYGRASGGVVNVITASGTNALHGTLTEFNRVAAYTANSVTNAQSGNGKGNYTRNQFGFFVGGPIVRNRLFFAAGSEWLRVRSRAIESGYVPTPNLIAYTAPDTQAFMARYGQELAFESVVTNAAAGSPFPALPEALPVFGLVNYSVPQDAGGGLPQNSYNYTLRGDYIYTDKTQIFARFVDWNLDEPLGSAFFTPYSAYDVGQRGKDLAALGGFTQGFSPALLISERASFSRINASNQATDAGIAAPHLFFSSAAQVNGLAVYLPGNGFGLPHGGPQNLIQWNQDLDRSSGKHSVKAGSQILYIQANLTYGQFAQADEALAGSVPGDSTGYGGFITGTLGTFTTAIDPQGKFPGEAIKTPVTQPNFARSDRFHDWAIYLQEVWRITPRLTLNYGLRYEYYGVQHNNKRSLDSNFYFGPGKDLAERIRGGAVETAPNSPLGALWSPSYGTVGPRLGFAYDVFGDGKTSFRGGYGISYERNFGNVTFNLIQNPPNYAVVVKNRVPVTTSNLGVYGSPIGNVPLPSTSLRQVSQNIRTAQTHFWNLSLERELAPNTVIEIAYVAARGIHLYDVKNVNGLGSGNYAAGDSYAAHGLTRLNSTYANINNRGTNGDSYYEGLDLRLQTTNFHQTGVSATANYTWGHEIDDLSSTLSSSYARQSGYNFGYTNPFDPGYDRGNGDFDTRHRFVASAIYESSWYKARRDLPGQALGGWCLAGIYTVRSGTPFTYFDSTYNYGDYYNIARYVPSTPLNSVRYTRAVGAVPGAVNQYYLARALPPGQRIANDAIGGYSNWAFPASAPRRNSFIGPGVWNLDIAASKTFYVSEKVNIELRAEGFDVLNHHNLYVEQALADAGNFYPSSPIITAKKGGINGAVNEERRFGQLALKVNF